MVINALNSGAKTFMADFEGKQWEGLWGCAKSQNDFRHWQYRAFSNFWSYLDSNAPTWENNISGQVNLRDAVRGTISFTNPAGKQYTLRKDGKAAVLLVR
jgi:malate synthase